MQATRHPARRAALRVPDTTPEAADGRPTPAATERGPDLRPIARRPESAGPAGDAPSRRGPGALGRAVEGGAVVPGRSPMRLRDRGASGLDTGRGDRAAEGGAEATPALRRALRDRIGPARFDRWFQDADLSIDGSCIHVVTDDAFSARWIDRHLSGPLRDVVRETFGGAALVEVRARETTPTEPVPPERGPTDDASTAQGPPGAPRSERPARGPVPIRTGTPRDAADGRMRPGARLRGLRLLSEFVVGDSNRLAWSAASALADGSGAAMGPLFIHGECGVGKTHLLQGICRAVLERRGGTGRDGAPGGVRYVTGEEFTNEYIAAVRSDGLAAFRLRYRRLDLLAIDDVHFLSNKVRTQSEFLHTLDAIDLTGSRVVLASDEHPQLIGRLNQALVSRFVAGCVVRIDPPDQSTRIALVRRLAAQRDLVLDDATVDAIARRCVGSVRELEGAVSKMLALRTLLPSEPSAEAESRALDRLLDERARRPAHPVSLPAIIEAVCAQLQISRGDLLGASRHRRLVAGRGVVAWLARSLTTMSYPEIAHLLGRRNHSTVHAAARRIEAALAAGTPIAVGDGMPDLDPHAFIDQLRRRIIRECAARPAGTP